MRRSNRLQRTRQGNVLRRAVPRAFGFSRVEISLCGEEASGGHVAGYDGDLECPSGTTPRDWPGRPPRLLARVSVTDQSSLSSVLLPDSPLTNRPGAGGRAPDAPCGDVVTGRPVRLFDLQRGTHWTLLPFGTVTVDQPVPLEYSADAMTWRFGCGRLLWLGSSRDASHTGLHGRQIRARCGGGAGTR